MQPDLKLTWRLNSPARRKLPRLLMSGFRELRLEV